MSEAELNKLKTEFERLREQHAAAGGTISADSATVEGELQERQVVDTSIAALALLPCNSGCYRLVAIALSEVCPMAS